jgi:hypothetical protein
MISQNILAKVANNFGNFWVIWAQYWSQSYDRELQRKRCKFLQRYG